MNTYTQITRLLGDQESIQAIWEPTPLTAIALTVEAGLKLIPTHFVYLIKRIEPNAPYSQYLTVCSMLRQDDQDAFDCARSVADAVAKCYCSVSKPREACLQFMADSLNS